jgi:hypothetical protein
MKRLKASPRWLASLALTAGLLYPSSAVADLFTFDITTGNSQLTGFSGPYAHVTVDLINPTTATITYTSDISGGNINLIGDGGSVGVNVNASSWTLSSITGSNAGAGFTPGPWSNGGAGNEDGFGSFNQTINSFDGFTHSSDTLSFTLTDTGGTWASAASVLVNNGDGFFAAMHVFVTASPANASNGAIVTGFAHNGPGSLTPGSVPEPSTFAIAGLGAFGFVGYGLRKRLQK